MLYSAAKTFEQSMRTSAYRDQSKPLVNSFCHPVSYTNQASFEPSSEIVGQVRRGSMGLTAEQDIMTMEMRLSVLRKPYALLMISLILLLVASMRAFESLYLAEARIPAIFRFIFFLSSRNSGIRHRCAQDIHLRRSSQTLSYPAFNARRRSSFSR